jgi:hypothetical protein
MSLNNTFDSHRMGLGTLEIREGVPPLMASQTPLVKFAKDVVAGTCGMSLRSPVLSLTHDACC